MPETTHRLLCCILLIRKKEIILTARLTPLIRVFCR